MNAQTDIVAATPGVYVAIAAIQGDLAKTGIAKNRENKQGSGYMFRGIDDVYAALAPLLSSHGLCVIPRMVDREVVERTSRNGGALFYTTVKAEFDFIAVADGSSCTACTYGEAMDSGDKSTNKAMSAAYKYAAFLTFAIPTEGDNDADAKTHDVQPREAEKHEPAEDMTPKGGWGDWARTLIETVNGTDKEETLDEIRDAEKRRINAAKKVDAAMFKAIGEAFTARRAVLQDEVPF